ncbi:bifunctional PIG-L family deacetylase/class I SAM-dependent methyltransferase [Arthrobacter sp. B0490]|uniref:bifunctional PIG-L family deacetylase/class I SAM-dependent methyltransferase n=1 Tax=Arthrobacter sp. B0490 TaxID=2058891 RepID=UPI000CE2D529|nr:bifunctional PIG-L family deacetylase/class I SAM-dependent methyltransferase [Arthrobacter sp. B0490]
MVSFTHDGEGTPEALWRAWEQEREPGNDLQVEALFDGRLPTRFLLLAAHPDDETLGAGALLARLAREGVRCDVVVLTDGDASHPSSPTYSPHQLAELRRREVADAVQVLAPAAHVSFEGLPDGRLRQEDVTAALLRALGDGDDTRTLVAAPWRQDGHPDHEAVGRAAADVCRGRDIPLLEYPIWLWHWGSPSDRTAELDALSLHRLSTEDQARKTSALATHTSQVLPLSDAPGDEVLLAPAVLEHFSRNFESFFVTAGSSTFERLHRDTADPWQVAERFYEQRKRALTMASLPRRRFGRTLEVGCSVGALTRELATVSDSLLALDTSETAVRRTSEALIMTPAATARLATVPRDWPRGEGPFDLVVLSETGYFLSSDQLDEVIRLIRASLDDDGVLLLCHWRHPIEGWELDGDAVHDRIRRTSGLTTLALHTEEDFVLEVLVPAPARSVARREGLL